MKKRAIITALLVLCTAGAQAECPKAEELAAFVSDFVSARQSQGLPSVRSLDDARCAQAALVERLIPLLGPVVGYKAALTSRVMRERLGVDGPVSGVLLQGMLLPDRSEVAVAAAAEPSYEADLLAVVKDESLQRARTLAEAARSISYVTPFIEVPDKVLDPGVKLTAAGLLAMNAGGRFGVMGTPIPMEETPEFLESLATMTVVLLEDGRELARGPGAALLEHPLNAAMWLARDLASAGIRLRPGDVLSLGAFLPAQPAKPGATVSVRYLGLPGDPSVSVRFK